MIEDALRERGFVQTLSDEPHEDYWLLEHSGVATDLLVESESDGWTVSRSPTGDEARGEWIEVRRGLSPSDAVGAVDDILDQVA